MEGNPCDPALKTSAMKNGLLNNIFKCVNKYYFLSFECGIPWLNKNAVCSFAGLRYIIPVFAHNVLPGL